MDTDFHRRIRMLFCLGACVLVCGSACFAQLFTAPNETFLGRNHLSALQQSIQDGKPVDAAERMDALLHDSADQLFKVDSGSLISVRQWMESLPLAQRQAMTAGYDQLVGDQAKAALDAVLQRPGRRPEELLAPATEFPLSTTARDALAQAATRALDLGDVGAAGQLAKRAQRLGWNPPAAMADHLTADATLAHAVPLTTAMPWYGQTPQQPARRIIPVYAGGVVFISTERSVIAAKENGQLLWQYHGPKVENPMPAAYNGYHRPAVLCDLAGAPQVVVARHLVGNTRFGCLRGFRASDGKLLWSTEISPAVSGWSLASTPVIAGRRAWVLAVDETQRPAPLSLMAIETMTGRLVSQTALGGFQNEASDNGSSIEALWSHSGVAIDGGDVFIAAGIGMVARVDRFDGRIRWVRTYSPVPTRGEQLRDLYRRAGKDWKARGPLNELADDMRAKMTGEPLDPKKRSDRGKIPGDAPKIADYFSTPDRWQTTPAVIGDVVVVAPVDSNLLLGLDRNTGAQLWENAEHAPSTLVGAAGGVAVLAGEGLAGVDVRSGKSRWTWTEGRIEGAPAVDGQRIRVVAGGKTRVIAGDTGGADALTAVGATITPLLRNDATKAALTAADGLSSLSPPRGEAKKR